MTTASIPANAVMLTEAQVAEMLQVNDRTIRRWVSGKRFPAPVRFGEGQRARSRWFRSEVDAWLAAKAKERE
jgi:excisionase family DNA binding protein